jgi:hypothetical protein
LVLFFRKELLLMSSFSRLWRRAPVWRFCLISAIAFTALAVMFPPVRPSWLPDHVAAAPPRFVAQPEAVPPKYGQLAFPLPGPGRSGVIPFSGHRLPLPAGSWQDLVLAKWSGTNAVQVELLSRVENQRLTGLELAAAPSPLNHSGDGFSSLAPCYASNTIAHESFPVLDTDPLAHECWTLSAVDMAAADEPLKKEEVLQRGLEILQETGVAVPPHMLMLSYLRSDETGWFTVVLLLPERGEASRRKIEAWARKFAPSFHKGYENSLVSADLAQMPRDPSS